jgi:low affinity Fe/Cu permease
MANNAKSTYGALERARDRFSGFAQIISHATGHPLAFALAVLVVVVWGVTGPIFNFSDTWQLVINTGTTIVTFLMVFLIQNTQNRDTLALQLKLSELVLAQKGADNSFVELENLSDAELENVHTDLCRRAEHTLGALERRKKKIQSEPHNKPSRKRSRKK